ncbi:MAG: hypothetical protein ABIQ44_06495 [Chloroflexia bacterium]
MTETTYFERPNLKVTDMRVISGVGVFQNADISRVRYRVGNIKWHLLTSVAFFLVMLVNHFTSPTTSIYSNLSPVLGFVVGFVLVLLSIVAVIGIWTVKLTYSVKIEGTFGRVTKVEFDCGTDWRGAIDLANALRRVTINKQHTGRVAGVA